MNRDNKDTALKVRQEITRRALMVCDDLIARGLVGSKKEAADKLGMCKQCFRSLEVGKANIQIENILTLHEQYNVSLDWMFTGGADTVQYVN